MRDSFGPARKVTSKGISCHSLPSSSFFFSFSPDNNQSMGLPSRGHHQDPSVLPSKSRLIHLLIGPVDEEKLSVLSGLEKKMHRDGQSLQRESVCLYRSDDDLIPIHDVGTTLSNSFLSSFSFWKKKTACNQVSCALYPHRTGHNK